LRTKALAISFALLAGAGASGCGTTTDTGSPSTSSSPSGSTGSTSGSGGTVASGGDLGCAATEGAVVGFSEPLPDPNFKIIEDILTEELAKVGATLKPVNANLDPGKQIGDIATLQQQGIQALIVNPVDPNAVQGALADVKAAGIPVIAEDTEVGGPYYTSVQSDSGVAGAEGAALMKSEVSDGDVAQMNGPPFAEILERSRIGFEAGADEEGLNIVDTQVNAQITPDAAKALAEQWKQRYGADLKGIWTFNDVSATGVASTFDDGYKPVLISINGQPDIIPLIKAGTVTATFDLQTDVAGRTLAYAAINAICGVELPEQIWVGAKLIDASNVDSWVPPAERAKDGGTITLEERDGKTYVVGS